LIKCFATWLNRKNDLGMNFWQALTIAILSSGVVVVIATYIFNKKLEEYRLSINRREKAADVATMLARWIKYRGREENLLTKKELIDYYEELTRMSFELSLWIEDEKLLSELMRLFARDPLAPNVREILGKIREELPDGKAFESFSPSEIIIWPADEIVEDVFDLKEDKNLHR